MKVLLINSDLAKNRGDRAIAEGIIQLIRRHYEDAEITGLSEHAEKDRAWYGIDFLKMDIHSLNPMDWIHLAKAAMRSDVIFWGGGEFLKDYTNQVALWYWFMKIAVLHAFNSEIYGVYQGVGPTASPLSKRLIAATVNKTRKFILRDRESYQKLIDWGVNKKKLVISSDPAVLLEPEELTETDKDLLNHFGIDKDFLNNYIAIAPRNWFHYKKGGLLPHRFTKWTSHKNNNPRNERYLESLVNLVNLISKHTKNILLVPMHLNEDIEFCKTVAQRVAPEVNMKILDDDIVDPKTLRNTLSTARLMVGFRLHACIIATSGCTPCINFYYVDKGRVYFDQIGQQEYSLPVEILLEEDYASLVSKVLEKATKNSSNYREELQDILGNLRHSIYAAFDDLHV